MGARVRVRVRVRVSERKERKRKRLGLISISLYNYCIHIIYAYIYILTYVVSSILTYPSSKKFEAHDPESPPVDLPLIARYRTIDR